MREKVAIRNGSDSVSCGDRYMNDVPCSNHARRQQGDDKKSRLRALCSKAAPNLLIQAESYLKALQHSNNSNFKTESALMWYSESA